MSPFHKSTVLPIAFQRMAVLKVEDRALLPLLEPEVARHLTVVLVDLAVAVLPQVELAHAHAEPARQPGPR